MSVVINGTTGITSPGGDTGAADFTINGLTVGRGGGNQTTITAVGNGALAGTNSGVGHNTGVGYQALYTNTTGTNCDAVGAYVLNKNTTGIANTAIGGSNTIPALYNNTTGGYNVALGVGSLFSNTTASNNTAVGYQAGYSNTTGANSVYIGYGSGYSHTAGDAVFIGYNAGNAQTSGNNNIGIGRGALYGSGTTSGSQNTSIGYFSMGANSTGNYNVAVGYGALNANTTSSNSTAVGYQSLYSQTNPTSPNTAFGSQAGYSVTTGTYNVLIGEQAGRAITTGTSNTFVGVVAGYSTTGSSNTFVGSSNGYGAGWQVTSGSKNTILGGFPGNQGGLDIRTASNYIVLSDGDGNPRMYWDNPNNRWFVQSGSAIQAFNGTGGSGGFVAQNTSNNTSTKVIRMLGYDNSETGSISTYVNSTSYNTSSDSRLKNDLGISASTEVIDNTIVHDFYWKLNNQKDIGVFAQEAQKVKPSAITEGSDELTESGSLAKPWSVDYSKYVPDLIVYCQQLNKTVQKLKAEVDSLKQQLASK